MNRALPPSVVISHAAATWFMVGLIWTIHVVHYPLFSEVGAAEYVEFQAAHVERIGTLLLIPWAVEGVTAAAILVISVAERDRRYLVPAVIGAVAMGVVLVVSGFWSAPAHADLADGFDADVHGRLMAADLVRTVAWTVRGACAARILAVFIGRSSSDRPPNPIDPADLQSPVDSR